MHLLYCDESNLEERAGDFLLYGGLTIPGERAHDLSRQIDEIRSDLRVPSDYHLKFNPGPENLDHEEFKLLKQRIIESAIDHGCTLLVYLVLHDLATGAAEARRFGINTLAYHFHCLLQRIESHGLVLIDRFSDREIDSQLRDRFLIGVRDMPFSPVIRLERVVGFHYSTIGQSHFASLSDVAVGSLRFAINAYTREQDEYLEAAGDILALMEPLFRRTPRGLVSNLSLHFSPRRILRDDYRTRYEQLRDFLSDNGLEAEQQIRAR